MGGPSSVWGRPAKARKTPNRYTFISFFNFLSPTKQTMSTSFLICCTVFLPYSFSVNPSISQYGYLDDAESNGPYPLPSGHVDGAMWGPDDLSLPAQLSTPNGMTLNDVPEDGPFK